jgi:hypothetical protein
MRRWFLTPFNGKIMSNKKKGDESMTPVTEEVIANRTQVLSLKAVHAYTVAMVEMRHGATKEPKHWT